MAFVALARRRSTFLTVTAAVFGAVRIAGAQAAPAAGTSAAPDVGQMAPDFTLPGATRYGLLKDPVHLADLRGNTVVLAFFFQARTKG